MHKYLRQPDPCYRTYTSYSSLISIIAALSTNISTENTEKIETKDMRKTKLFNNSLRVRNCGVPTTYVLKGIVQSNLRGGQTVGTPFGRYFQ